MEATGVDAAQERCGVGAAALRSATTRRNSDDDRRRLAVVGETGAAGSLLFAARFDAGPGGDADADGGKGGEGGRDEGAGAA